MFRQEEPPPSLKQNAIFPHRTTALPSRPHAHQSPSLPPSSTTTSLPSSAPTGLHQNQLRSSPQHSGSHSPSYWKQGRTRQNPKNKSVVKQIWKKEKKVESRSKKERKIKTDCLVYFSTFEGNGVCHRR